MSSAGLWGPTHTAATTLPPELALSQTLPGGWGEMPMISGSMASWAESFELFDMLGSSGWWHGTVAAFPGHAVLVALAREPELMASLVGIPQGGRVLDLACGPGVTTRMLLMAGAAEAIGMDVAAAMIDVSEQGPPLAGVSFFQGDLRVGLPFPDDNFDASVLGDFYDSAAVAEMLRVVRPGGLVSVRMTDVVPGMFYGCDPDLDRRVHAAYLAGERARFGSSSSGTTSWVGEAFVGGLTHVKTVPFERVGTLDRLVGAFLLASDMWRLGNAAGRLSRQDSARVRELWDPANPEALLHRSDNHLLQNMTLATAVVG